MLHVTGVIGWTSHPDKLGSGEDMSHIWMSSAFLHLDYGMEVILHASCREWIVEGMGIFQDFFERNGCFWGVATILLLQFFQEATKMLIIKLQLVGQVQNVDY